MDHIDEKEFNELNFDETDVMLSIADEENNISLDNNINGEVYDAVYDELRSRNKGKKVTKKEVSSAFQVIKDYFNQEGL